MTSYRRLLRIALVLATLISLLLLCAPGALAEDPVLGKTNKDKVNVRVGASTSAKLLFQIPHAGYVGTVHEEKDAEGIHWYKVEFQSPDEGNDRYYIGYVNGGFFDRLTPEEAALYKMGDTIAAPTLFQCESRAWYSTSPWPANNSWTSTKFTPSDSRNGFMRSRLRSPTFTW